MIRAVLTLFFLLSVWMPAAAQDFRAVARVEATESHLIDQGDGAELRLALTQAVPFRVFTLEGPDRVVIDFREVTWGDLGNAFNDTGAVISVATGGAGAGWSRMVRRLSGCASIRWIAPVLPRPPVRRHGWVCRPIRFWPPPRCPPAPI